MSECIENRMHVAFQEMRIADLSVEDAWRAVEEADSSMDLDDIKKVSGVKVILLGILTILTQARPFSRTRRRIRKSLSMRWNPSSARPA